MALSNNGDVCIAGSSNKELKFVAKFLLSILSLAIKNLMKSTNLCISWVTQPFVQQTIEAKKR